MVVERNFTDFDTVDMRYVAGRVCVYRVTVDGRTYAPADTLFPTSLTIG